MKYQKWILSRKRRILGGPASIALLIAFMILTTTRVAIQKITTEKTSFHQNMFVEAVVSKNTDGDTIHVKMNKKDYTLRFIGVDSPETVKDNSPVEYYGKEASDFTKSKLTIGRKIWLENDVSTRDKYGRLLKYVWLEKPEKIDESEIRAKMLNAILVEEGYAKVMTVAPDVRYSDYFATFEDEARAGGKGLWNVK